MILLFIKGRPSQKKAKMLKLKREAAELDLDNIISDRGKQLIL